MCVVCLCVVWFVCGVGYSRERECNEIALMKREVMKRWKGEGKGEGKGKKRHSEGWIDAAYMIKTLRNKNTHSRTTT